MAETFFDTQHVVGTFRGFSEGGMEFHADLVLPHRDDFQSIAMHGQFVLVELEHDQEAVLGRVTAVSAQGRLVSPIGEDYAIRAVRDQRPIPDELREQYLKYKVDVRILGVLRRDSDTLVFVPSHRRLPHVGSRVAFPSDDLLGELANSGTMGGAELGFFALGEFIYAGDDPRLGYEPWMMVRHPAIVARFQIDKLVSRRSYVFARAGFGKSNLVKLLFSTLYSSAPTIRRREGRQAPVGTVIFDPDGEYYWPDDRNRPALADVPALQDELVVFTNKHPPSGFYGSFVVDGVKLDIRSLSPRRVVSIAVSAERQDQQNVAKLKALSQDSWRQLVNLAAEHKFDADRAEVARLLKIDKPDDVQVNAALSNMIRIVEALHDPSSQLLRVLKRSLSDGKLCVVDISQMRGEQGLQLAGIILNDIFLHNQEQFTAANPETIPTIAVIEEAQSILGGSSHAEDGPFVSWVKEGRKYDLGAVMVTQQPGSLPQELVSQGDNFFVFHLLSASDLQTLKRANAHFSDDILAALLNEPLVGHGVYWSSAPGTDQGARPYPLSVRVLSFDGAYSVRDKERSGDAVDNYASRLRTSFAEALTKAAAALNVVNEADAVTRDISSLIDQESPGTDGLVDVEELYLRAAISPMSKDKNLLAQLRTPKGVEWWRVQKAIAGAAPPAHVVGSQWDWAFTVVAPALNRLLPEGWTKERRPHPSKPGEDQAWVRSKKPAATSVDPDHVERPSGPLDLWSQVRTPGSSELAACRSCWIVDSYGATSSPSHRATWGTG